MTRYMPTMGLVLVAASLSGCGTSSSPTGLLAAQGASGTYRTIWDNFHNGFDVSSTGKWFYFGAGSFSGDDGVTQTSQQLGLQVIPRGTNPVTGYPAFTKTLGQEGSLDNPDGLPGGIDHVKWLVYMNHLASSGYPGFDATVGHELSCETVGFAGKSYGTAAHPFGTAVVDAEDDLRLGASAMNVIDFETFMVFDFFMSNKKIYAFYERLPFGRTPADNYAAFSFQIPVADNRPLAEHRLKIAYNKSAGEVRWLVDNKEVYRVTQIGRRISRTFLTIDHGGDEADVSPRQLDCGMGMFTLLDGSRPSGQAMVKLSNTPSFYFSPLVGSPASQMFVDPISLPASRLFGQGAELRVRQYVVSNLPSR